MVASCAPSSDAHSGGTCGARSRIVFFAVIAASVVSVARWSVWNATLEVQWDSVVCAGRIVFASVVLMVLGATVTHTVLKVPTFLSWIPASVSVPFISRALIFILLGQLACMVWVFIRSGISGMAYKLTGIQLPITVGEVVALCVALFAGYLIDRKKLQPRTVKRQVSKQTIARYLSVLLLVVCAFAPHALRELPRSIALSSDPDQHAYFAHQILRLGGIPWDQGIFGDGPLGYPSGFAVLNAVWMFFSGIPAVEIITVQPMIQCMLALLLCAAVIPCCRYGSRRNTLAAYTDRVVVASSLALIVCYWFIFPFGSQANRYLGSGTARLSTSLLSAILCVSWILSPGRMLPLGVRRVRVGVFASVTALLVTFNPMTALLAMLLTSVAAVSLVIEPWLYSDSRRDERLFRRSLGSILCLSPLLLILCDPYFVDITFSGLQHLFSGVPSSQGAAQSRPVVSYITLPSRALWSDINPSQVVRLLLAGTGNDLSSSYLVMFFVLLATIIWCRALPLQAGRYLLLVVVTLLLLWLADGIHLAPSEDTPLYLVQPYIVQSLWDSGVVLGALLISGVIVSTCMLYSMTTAFSALVLAVAITFIATHSVAASNKELTLAPRVSTCGSFGCVTPNDVETFRFVKDFGNAIVSKYRGLDYSKMPKILILGHPAIHGPEKWVFPYGASRVLPIESPLPVAFFYGQGSKKWNYKSYMQNVCSQFNIDWLRSNNIRYLFVPESNPGCLRGRERVLSEMPVLFESGPSRFLQIAPDKLETKSLL